MRFIGQLFLLAALIALGLDIMATTQAGGFRLRPLGEVWFHLDKDSWLLLQPAIERHIHQDLWFSVVEPITRQSAVLLFAVVGTFLLGFSYLLARRG